MCTLTRWARRLGHSLYQCSGAAALVEAFARPRAAILLFHRITDAIPEDGLTVGTARFARLCRLLRDRFHAVPLADVFALARSGRPIPPRTVAITFDDTYGDNLAAARVLQRHGLPATFFLTTGYVGTDRVYEWDRGLPRLPNLSWDDVRGLREMGFEVGSHSVTHPDLGRATLGQAREELVASKRALETRLGQPVRWFAYPYGGVEHIRPGVLPLVEEAGYEGCLSGYGGFVEPGCDPRVLPRIGVPPFEGERHLDLYLSGSLDWFYALKRRLGLMGPPPRPSFLDAPPRRAGRHAPVPTAAALPAP